MRFDERDAHEDGSCVKRVVACGLGCGQHLMQEKMKVHLARDCKKRLQLCPLGCGVRVRAFKMSVHIKEECKLPCKWNCGAVIGPKDRREVHEEWICPLRIVGCKNGCGIENLKDEDRLEHQNSKCPKRILSCSLGCGIKLKAEDVSRHQTGEAGDCPRRMLRCRLDMLGKRIKVRRPTITTIGDARGSLAEEKECTEEKNVPLPSAALQSPFATLGGE